MSPREPRSLCLFGLVSKHPGHNRGGTAVCIRRLADFFAARGVRVDILMRPADPDHFLFTGLAEPVKVRQIPAQSKLGLFAALVRHVHREQPEVLLALDNRASQIASWLSLLPGSRPDIWTSFHSRLNPDHQRLLTRIAKRSTGVITISQGLGRDFARLTGIAAGRLHVLPNLVITEAVEAAARQPVDHPWLQDGTHPVLIAVGRLVPEKGLEHLLRALPRVRTTHPDVRLIVLGQGPLRASLLNLASKLNIEKHVDFAGFQDNPWAFMARADLFVLPSLTEAFGNVLAEALSLGVPVVASDCPHGPTEILQNGRLGRLVPPADHAALAEAILETLANPLPEKTLVAGAERFREASAGQEYLALLGLGRDRE